MVEAPTSVSVHKHLVHVLREDLIGPDARSAHARETLTAAPSRWYLTGFLVPHEANDAQRADPTAQEEMDLGGDAVGADDDTTPEKVSGRKAFFPSTLGVSVLVHAEADALYVTVTWGDYTALESPDDPDAVDADKFEAPPGAERWARTPKRAEVLVPLRGAKKRAATVARSLDRPRTIGAG